METNYPNRYRWVILSLLFVATTINYMDRIVLSVLIPTIKSDLNLNDIAFGHILSAFQLTYTLGFLFVGKMIDKMGTKLGYLLSILLWSAAAAMHGVCRSASCLAIWRGALGITQSGNFPAAIKSVSEWFHVQDRSFATSLFNAGSSISNIIGPPLIVALALQAGWRWTFVAFGLLGFLLVAVWQVLYKSEKQPEFEQDQTKEHIPWLQLLRDRRSYAIMLGKFFTDPVWWFYLFWMPNYLSSQRGFDLKEIAFATPLIYIVATLIGFVGGWFPGFLMRKGWSVSRARKTTMALSAALLPITAFAVFAPSPWLAIALVSLACGAHNSWSANIFTLTSDCFPSRAVGSMTGLAGFAGGLGGLLFATLLPGYIVEYFGYVPIFVLMGVLHPIAYGCVHVFLNQDK